MNNLSQLEKDLRAWSPRQPSAKLKQRIFGDAPASERHSLPVWSWLAPVVACLFVGMAALHQHDAFLQPGKIQFSGAMAASNQINAVSSSNTFEWTNEANPTSSVRSQLKLGTNN
jgi:hypothetical protein